MKIGLVCPYNIERNGGVLEVILALEEGLLARGHQVKIITPNPRSNTTDPRDDVIYAGTSVDFRTLSFTDTTSQVSSTADNEKIEAMLEAVSYTHLVAMRFSKSTPDSILPNTSSLAPNTPLKSLNF